MARHPTQQTLSKPSPTLNATCPNTAWVIFIPRDDPPTKPKEKEDRLQLGWEGVEDEDKS